MSAASQPAPAVPEGSTAVLGCCISGPTHSATPITPNTHVQRFDRRHPWFPLFRNCASLPSSSPLVFCSLAAEARKPAQRHPPKPPSGAPEPGPFPRYPSPQAHRAPATTSLAQSAPTPRCGIRCLSAEGIAPGVACRLLGRFAGPRRQEAANGAVRQSRRLLPGGRGESHREPDDGSGPGLPAQRVRRRKTNPAEELLSRTADAWPGQKLTMVVVSNHSEQGRAGLQVFGDDRGSMGRR